MNKKNAETKQMDKKMQDISYEIIRITRTSDNAQDKVIPYAYLLWKTCSIDKKEAGLNELLSNCNYEFVTSATDMGINESEWNEVKRLLKTYSIEDFSYVVSNYVDGTRSGMESYTPSSIVKLVNAIIGPRDNSTFVDICCGRGSLLTEMAKEYPTLHYHGIDICRQELLLAKLRTDVISADNIEFHFDNAFTSNVIAPKSADFIFADPPHGMRMNMVEPELKVIENDFPVVRNTSFEWAWASIAMKLLNDEGKAIIIMPEGCMFGGANKDIRKHFVDNGWIESVINMPKNMFPYMGIATVMVILSRGNENIRLVDASDLYVKGRRINTFDDNDIEVISKALNEDSEISVTIDKKMFEEHDFSLYAPKYLEDIPEFQDGVVFESIIKRITRGSLYKAAELDDLHSEDETGYQCLMPASIQDGIIDINLPYLTKLESKDDKYCLNDHSLVLMKMVMSDGTWKIAVMDDTKGKKIIAGSNYYIIDVDESKADPYYIQAFLESTTGRLVLNSIAVGSNVKMISIEDIRKLIIPLPALDIQHEIGNEFKACLKTIDELKKKIVATQATKTMIFDGKYNVK